MIDLLLITPAFTQLNTPYPATAFLKGFANTKGISSYQMDLGIEVILDIFSSNNLSFIFKNAQKQGKIRSKNAKKIYAQKHEYLQSIDNVILFLQGKNNKFSKAIYYDSILPEASRFDVFDQIDWVLDEMELNDKAKYLATLYLEDLSDFIVECVDENFGFSRYAEKLGRSANSFDDLEAQLNTDLSFIDILGVKRLEKKIAKLKPKILCVSVPFPGNLFSAFRYAQFVKQQYPKLTVIMGGGFPNTELRSVSDIRIFDYFDFITLDDGELPIELILKNINNLESDSVALKRTFSRINNKVIYNNKSNKKDYSQNEIGTPDYSDLLLNKYISVIEIANPMHSLWSDGRWNKLMLAHGCYWGKCAFCDISLDYIKSYAAYSAKNLVNKMEKIIDQTKESGFHFVDEAAPPVLMRELAKEIINRQLSVTWWTNIRFEKNFTLELCELLHESGCIAVAGGLEVASNRLLELINKGVSVEQVSMVTSNFTKAGIMVHAYLMYGFPSQTEQETIDSLEMVRQMFELGIVQSGFWHQFALTAHSDVGLNPNKYGITPDNTLIKTLQKTEKLFANNDIEFTDNTGITHSKFSSGLKQSLFNFMHGVGFENSLQNWFDFEIPEPNVAKDYIFRVSKHDSFNT